MAPLKLLQNEEEITSLAKLAAAEGVRSYLEVGSKFGGSFAKIVPALPKGSTVVSVDLPQGGSEHHLKQVIAGFSKDYETHLILGDSTAPDIIELVRALGPFDLIFIDANHTEPYVRKDWATYGPMGRLIAFHDIGWVDKPGREGRLPIQVPKVWNEIKQGFRHVEFKKCAHDNGIGVLWRS
jgi:predicted O-methyltransferase YrrM